MTHFHELLEDQDGHMTHTDRKCLHQIIRAFFFRSIKPKMFEFLQNSEVEKTNMERDIEKMNNLSEDKLQQKQLFAQDNNTCNYPVLMQSKLHLKNIKQIYHDIVTQMNQNNIDFVYPGIQKIREMLQITDEVRYLHELQDISDFLAELFMEVIQTGIFNTFPVILKVQATPTMSQDLHNTIYSVKLEILKILSYFSFGLKYFKEDENAFNQIQEHLLGETDPNTGVRILFDEVSKLLYHPDLKMRNQLFETMGHYIQHGLPINFPAEYIERVFQHVDSLPADEGLIPATWFLFTYSKHQFKGKTVDPAIAPLADRMLAILCNIL